MAEQRFAFRFDPRFARIQRLLGITERTAYAQVDGARLHVRFGPWTVDTPRSNVTSAQVSGRLRCGARSARPAWASPTAA